MNNHIENIQKNLNYEEINPNTYKRKLLDFSIGKVYKPIAFFWLGGRLATVNGVLCQVFDNGNYSPVYTRGENLFHCAVCGTMIANHYTVLDTSNNKEINVGSECITKIINPKVANLLTDHAVSVERKAKEQFRRPIKNQQLTQFLKDNIDRLNDIRNKRIDKLLIDNPEHYYKPKYNLKFEKNQKTGNFQYVGSVTKEVIFKDKTKVNVLINDVYDINNPIDYEYDIQSWKNYNAPNYRRGTFPNNDQIITLIRKKGSDWKQTKDRTSYKYLLDNINLKQWNPETMKKAIYGLLAEDSLYDESTLNLSIKWNKLTDNQQAEEKQFISRIINEYINNMQNKYNDKNLRIY